MEELLFVIDIFLEFELEISSSIRFFSYFFYSTAGLSISMFRSAKNLFLTLIFAGAFGVLVFPFLVAFFSSFLLAAYS